MTRLITTAVASLLLATATAGTGGATESAITTTEEYLKALEHANQSYFAGVAVYHPQNRFRLLEGHVENLLSIEERVEGDAVLDEIRYLTINSLHIDLYALTIRDRMLKSEVDDLEEYWERYDELEKVPKRGNYKIAQNALARLGLVSPWKFVGRNRAKIGMPYGWSDYLQENSDKYPVFKDFVDRADISNPGWLFLLKTGLPFKITEEFPWTAYDSEELQAAQQEAVTNIVDLGNVNENPAKIAVKEIDGVSSHAFEFTTDDNLNVNILIKAENGLIGAMSGEGKAIYNGAWSMPGHEDYLSDSTIRLSLGGAYRMLINTYDIAGLGELNEPASGFVYLYSTKDPSEELLEGPATHSIP